MAQVALAFAILRIGNASDLGFVFLAREIPIVVFLLLGGIWADRVSRKVRAGALHVARVDRLRQRLSSITHCLYQSRVIRS